MDPTVAAALRYIDKGLHQLLPYFGIGHLSLLAALGVLGTAVGATKVVIQNVRTTRSPRVISTRRSATGAYAGM